MAGNTSTEHSTAFVSSSESEYARRRRQHMALINQLRSIGAQADLDLPRIAVIGNQSAGKSSLVEAISGISVPRDAGTCTRCPMECRLMSSSEPWCCQIYIRWEFEPNGKRKEKVQEVAFGSLITKKDQVELFLRRAQSAVLNPSVDSSMFLSKNASALKSMNNETKFSRNTVCVQLSGPELADLAFVDLPGIIQNERPEIIQLIEDLVKSSIEGNCLILVTLPMSDDIENQKAARLAQLADPSGLRTIGVMTKPDTIPSGASKVRDNWLNVIEGRRHSTKLGYYCTRQPDDDERTKGITSDQAREAEKNFFAKQTPWSTSTAKERFGTENLVTSLSRLLAKIIDDSLPKIQNEVTSQLAFCKSALEELPEAVTSDPASYVLTLVTQFSQEVARYVNGGETHAADLVQSNRRVYAQYKHAIRSSAPPFMPYPTASEAGVVTDHSRSLQHDDDDDDEYSLASTSKPLYLDDVRKHIELSLSRELPNNVPYASKVTLIEAFQAPWEKDTKKCFEDVYQAFENTLLSLINQKFKRYDNLKGHIVQMTRELLRHKHATTWSHLQVMLELEKIPYTQNGHYLQVTTDKHLSLYKAARVEAADSPPAKKSKVSGPAVTNGFAAGKSGVSATATPTSKSTNTGGAFDGFNFGQPSAGFATAFGGFGTSKGQNTPNDAPRFGVPSKPDVAVKSPAPASFSTTPEGTAAPKPSEPIPAARHAVHPTPTVHETPAGASRKRGLEDDTREQYEQEAIAALAKLGYVGLTPDDLGKLHPPDIYEEELEVMAEVRAYFQVAYKRVIDYVPMMIDRQFLFAFKDSLQGFLIEKLGLGTQRAATRCALYLAEDPTIVGRRDELTRKKERLERVQMDLDNFDISFGV